jgi:hypothetical protein
VLVTASTEHSPHQWVVMVLSKRARFLCGLAAMIGHLASSTMELSCGLNPRVHQGYARFPLNRSQRC